MGNQVGRKTVGGREAPSASKSTTGADFQKSLRSYQAAQSEYAYLSKITHCKWKYITLF